MCGGTDGARRAMLRGRTLLAVVPARGGSAGLPLKNLRPLLGRPLVACVGALIQELDYIDRAIVSTDHLEIARAAAGAGLAVPFLRPPELSGDIVSDYQVLRHALLEVERSDQREYDIVVMLQPTCPLRSAAHVTAAVDTLITGRWDSVWTVSPTDMKFHPLKQLRVAPDGTLDYFDPRGASVVARQQLDQVYHRNGAAYAVTRACLLHQGTIKGRRAGAVVIEDPLVNVDSAADLERAEALLRERLAESTRVQT